jgi:hypothetical protein
VSISDWRKWGEQDVSTLKIIRSVTTVEMKYVLESIKNGVEVTYVGFVLL